MRGVIYTRVSSDEQVKGMSLEFQQQDCLRYAQERNIAIVQIFEEEGETAKFADRPELINLLEYCRKHRGKVDVLLVWKLDRLSRVQMDYYYLKRLLISYGVSIHSATEPAMGDPDSVAGKVFETFAALQAEIDNTTRRERTLSGMSAKIAAGIYPWKPPLGYKCAQNRLKGLKKTEPDEPDQERFPTIQRLFRSCLEGDICSSVALAQLANQWGLKTGQGKKVYPQMVDRIMGNKFYAGLLFDPWKKAEVAGKHRPMVTPEEFYKVQWLRKGKPLPAQRRRVENPDFPLRKIVKCGFCQGPLTGSWSKGNGGRYAYYHCPGKLCRMYGKGIQKTELEQAFLEKLAEITPKPEKLELFKAVVTERWQREQQTLGEFAQSRKRTLRELEASLDRLIEMRMKNLLSDEEFLSRKEKINNEIAGARVSLSEAEVAEFDLEAALSYAMNFIANLPRQWLDMPPETKQRFQKTVFPEGIPYKRGEGFGTARLGLIYELHQGFDGEKTHLVPLVCATWNQMLEELRLFEALQREECGLSALVPV